MGPYLLRRLLAVVPVLLAVSLVVFLLMRLVPGDLAEMISPPTATPEEIDQIREALGLKQPLHVQYWVWITRALQGDLGYSAVQRAPVLSLLLSKFSNTLVLAAVAMVLAVTLGVAAGIVSAVRQYSWLDHAVALLALFGNSMAPFWLGLVLILLFSLQLRLFPTSGMTSPRGGGDVADVVWHLVLPAFTLAVTSIAIIARMMRSSMLEVIRQDYVRTARAKGLREGQVILVHAVKNALLPVVTVVGTQTGFLLGGSIVVETVFAWPGIGLLMFKAISTRDFLLVQGGVLLVAMVFVIINLLVDLLYGALDPRIQYA